MNDQHPYRAAIPPVPEQADRPLWSVMIPTYNCANHLRETLGSVLAQDPGPEMMQIEVIDDCSAQDDPAMVVKELGRGRIGFYRQPQNVGHVRNFETCLLRSRGRLVHLLHGDDCVLDGFYAHMQRAFQAEPKPGAAFCRHIYMDEGGHWQYFSPLLQPASGILSNWLERMVVGQHIQAPSIVVRRDVYEMLGGFDRRFMYYYEDWEMWVRIATRYPVWYQVEPLAVYRLRSASNSGRSMRTGENVRDVRRGIEIVGSYLPEFLPPMTISELLRQNRENSAVYALGAAHRMLTAGDAVAGITQVLEALRCSHSWKVIDKLVRMLLIAAVSQIRCRASPAIRSHPKPRKRIAR